MENLLPNKENFSEKPLGVLWDFRLCALVCSFLICCCWTKHKFYEM